MPTPTWQFRISLYPLLQLRTETNPLTKQIFREAYQKLGCNLRNSASYYYVHKSPQLNPILSQINTFHTIAYLFLVHFNLAVPYKRWPPEQSPLLDSAIYISVHLSLLPSVLLLAEHILFNFNSLIASTYCETWYCRDRVSSCYVYAVQQDTQSVSMSEFIHHIC